MSNRPGTHLIIPSAHVHGAIGLLLFAHHQNEVVLRQLSQPNLLIERIAMVIVHIAFVASFVNLKQHS